MLSDSRRAKFPCIVNTYCFPKRQISDSSELKEFAEDNFKLDKNGRKFSKRVENTVGKGGIARSVFKSPVLQTSNKQGLLGKGLKNYSFPFFLKST